MMDAATTEATSAFLEEARTVLGAVPARPGSVVVDMSGMNRVLRVDTEDLNILVETGVTWAQIHDALRDSDYHIPFLGTFSGIRATVGGGLGNWGRRLG